MSTCVCRCLRVKGETYCPSKRGTLVESDSLLVQMIRVGAHWGGGQCHLGQEDSRGHCKGRKRGQRCCTDRVVR